MRGGVPAFPHPRLDLTAIADLADFDGNSDGFDTWWRQMELLWTTCRLDDDCMKVLVGMKLKKKALEST